MGVQQNDTTQANLRNMIYWKDVPYGNGGSVVAIARDKSGKEVARHRIETAGKAVALQIETETPADWKADGMDLQYINAVSYTHLPETISGGNGGNAYPLSSTWSFGLSLTL